MVQHRRRRGAAHCDKGGAGSAPGAGARTAPRTDLPVPTRPRAGAPGSVSSLLQQAGRAGRREQPSASIYVAFDGPTDQFFFRHPDRLFGRPVEAAMIDAENAQLLGQHLACAAVELPLLLAADQAYFGARVPDVAAELRAAGARRGRRRWRVCLACGARCGSSSRASPVLSLHACQVLPHNLPWPLASPRKGRASAGDKWRQDGGDHGSAAPRARRAEPAPAHAGVRGRAALRRHG